MIKPWGYRTELARKIIKWYPEHMPDKENSLIMMKLWEKVGENLYDPEGTETNNQIAQTLDGILQSSLI